jgi:mycothiol synthase
LPISYGGFGEKALLKIRPFRKGFDEEAYVSIYNAAFRDYKDIRRMTLEEMKKMEKSPSFNADGLFIAEWNGETAGMVHAYVDKLREERKGFIQSLGVLPRFRRKGIARELLRKAIDSLKQRGMKTAEAWAQSDREGCVHLYESFGFSQARVTSMMKRSLTNIPYNIGENTEIKIRNMQMTDEEEIILLNTLDNETFKEHFNFRPRTIEETKYALFEMPWFQKQKWFFAILGNDPLGYAGIGVDDGLNKEKNLKWGWILDIGVLKSHRRKGIGACLMLHSMRSLLDNGMDDAVLYVDDMNPTGAIKLYEKLGFKAVTKNIVYQLPLNQI